MNVLGMFAKRPQPGRVKTRIAESLGDAAAAELYAGFLRELVSRFANVADRRYLCYAPGDSPAQEYFRDLAAGEYRLWPQPEMPLGERLAAFFGHAFAAGARRVVVIGSDSPTLPRDIVTAAFRELESRDVAVGPAADGGYYLIGQRGQCRPIFDRIDWSSSRVLSQTAEGVESCGASLAVLPVWYDVDSAEDLDFLEGHRRALRLAGEAD